LAPIINALEDIHLPGAWLTIGSFDGVHRGHQELIRNMVRGAHQVGSPAVVLTFYPHPVVVLRGLKGPYYLTTPDERSTLLKDLGVDAVFTLAFDLQMAAITAEDFMARVNIHLSPKQLWVGNNFALGRNRQGDVPTLRLIGERLGYQLNVVAPVVLDGETVSSTMLRQLLLAGDVEQAVRGLGRFYALGGEIIHGDGRGRGLGIPTANLAVWPEQIIPEYGIYACWAWVDGKRWPAVTNVGVRPTFESNDSRPRVEAHILDFDQDLYGKRLRLEFVTRLREERRYSSIEALMDQIALDIKDTRVRLKL
jgi:riboflavin kinase / FMN adenylyltransferase